MLLLITSCSSQASVETVGFTTITNTLQKASNPAAELPYDSVSLTYSIAWPVKGDEATVRRLREWTLTQLGIKTTLPENADTKAVRSILDKHAQMLLAQDATDADGSFFWERELSVVGESDTPFEGYVSMTSEITNTVWMGRYPDYAYSNICIRLNDGEEFDPKSAIADEDLARDLIVEAIDSQAKEEDASWCWNENIIYSREELPMPDRLIALTREGVEFEYVMNELGGPGPSYTVVIPYDRILPALSAKAIAFLPKEITGEDAKQEQAAPEAAALSPKDEAVRFLYQTFYDKETISALKHPDPDTLYTVGFCSLGYSKDALEKFRELGISSGPDYPTTPSHSEEDDHYIPYYTESLNALLKKVDDYFEKNPSDLMMIMSYDFEGEESPFYLNIKKVEEISPEKIIVTASENPDSDNFTYVLVKQNGRWYIDDIYNYRQIAKDILENKF